ncbi:MAG: ABC transporter substrate-binding protein [Phycisphaerae bacterium]
MSNLLTLARFVAAAVVVVVCLAGCGGEEPHSAPPTIRVGYVGHDHQLALYVAALQGRKLNAGGVYLKERKFKEVYDLVDGDRTLATLELIKVGGAANMPTAMSRGEIAIGLGGVASVARFVDRGAEFRIICPLQTEGDQLVMHADSPVSDWASFVSEVRKADRPLRIGYKGPVACAKMVFVKALDAEGIRWTHDPGESEAGVLMVHMVRGPNAIAMLSGKKGDVPLDGFVMNQPVSAKAEQMGLGKVVAQLRDLPPEGAWHNHPCCCVAATQDVLDRHPRQVKALLKLLIAATDRMHADPKVAVDVAVEWTGSPREVEQRSVPTVRYVGRFSEDWLAALATYYGMMQEVGAFKGRYKDMPPEKIVADAVDTTLCDQAATELDGR